MAESTRKRGKPSLLKENTDPAADGEDSEEAPETEPA